MGHSRITLATLLALGLLGTAQADEPGQEPFHVELKGPDEPAPPAIPSQPVAHPAVVTPQPWATAKPKLMTPPAAHHVTSNHVGSYGPIRPSDTLWSLANRYRPSHRVSVYQTMVAIYDKNPRSFADGNINHILVGARILLPTTAEASRITDAQARQRFNSDNASWKGLSPKYLAIKQIQGHAAKPAVAKSAGSKATTAPVKAAVIPAEPPKVTPPQPATEVKEIAKAAEPVVSQAPAPLPAATTAPAGKPSTEMALDLEDANAQLGQVTEMNHRLKLRLQSLTDENETLKAQLQDQTTLQKEIVELKTKPVPPVAAPESKQHWLMELTTSPLNLAMLILLPVLLVLALVTLWLRARARRELEEQERSLSESTSMMMEQEHSEFDRLMTAGIAAEEAMAPMPEPETADGNLAAAAEPAAPADVVLHADEEPEPLPASKATSDMSEEERQAALFAELDAELIATPREDDRLADDEDLAKSKAAVVALEWDSGEPAFSDFEDSFAEVESHPVEALPKEPESGYVEIEKLLDEANTSAAEPEPYQGFSLDVGLDGFPEVLPASTGFDVDDDDGGVGAKLDLARAYLEIDDKHSARELLQEAVTEGSDHQRAEAQRLLKRLG